MCVKYPGSRWLMGREELKRLKQSTLLTLLKVMRDHGLRAGVDYRYNKIDSYVEIIKYGSTIYLKDLAHKPSDPEFDDLGSAEFTGAFVDEAQQITAKAYNVIISRLRYRTKEWGIPGRLLMTCNPSRGFLKDYFYTPWKEGRLEEQRAFVQSLVHDNKKIGKQYIDALGRLDPATKRRLLMGDWDYEDAPDQLVPNLWVDRSITGVVDTSRGTYLGVDVAREGDDKTMLALVQGITLVDLHEVKINIQDHDDISGKIAEYVIDYMKREDVGYRDVIIDAVGNGGGVLDAMRARGYFINTFKGSETPETIVDSFEFRNKRHEAGWRLRESFQNNEIKLLEGLPELQMLTDEITAFKFSTEKEPYIDILKKSEVKKLLNRSPDRFDALSMANYLRTSKLKPISRDLVESDNGAITNDLLNLDF